MLVSPQKNARKCRVKRSRADLRIPALGSGSDYTVFVDHLGVASVNLGFGGEDEGGQYHSIYDDFYWYTHFQDTDFSYGRALAQTAGTICLLSLTDGDRPKNVYFLTIDKAKFRKPVVPGDTIEYHVSKISQRKRMWWFRGEAKVEGELVAEAEVGAAIADKS